LTPQRHPLTHGLQQLGQRAADRPGDAGAQQRIDNHVGVQHHLLQLLEARSSSAWTMGNLSRRTAS
jgi:hypothetical protein